MFKWMSYTGFHTFTVVPDFQQEMVQVTLLCCLNCQNMTNSGQNNKKKKTMQFEKDC